jgi:hypothetical protein
MVTGRPRDRAAAGVLTSAAGRAGPRRAGRGGSRAGRRQRASERVSRRQLCPCAQQASERENERAGRRSHLPHQLAHSGLFPFLGVRQCLGRPKPCPQMARTTTTSSRITGPSFLSGSTQCAGSVPTGNGAGDPARYIMNTTLPATWLQTCVRGVEVTVMIWYLFPCVMLAMHGGCTIADGKHFVSRFAACCKGSPSISSFQH